MSNFYSLLTALYPLIPSSPLQTLRLRSRLTAVTLSSRSRLAAATKFVWCRFHNGTLHRA